MPPLKRILFLNRSFYPDVEATGQLLTELCRELSGGYEVHVVCGRPLYRRVKHKGIIGRERHESIHIWRVMNTALPKKFFLSRIINLLSYFILCFLGVFFLKKADCVISETDPPLLASVAYVYSRIRGCAFIYYSQDIWPQVGVATGRFSYPVLPGLLQTINGFLYKKADHIIVLGRDMKGRLEEEHRIAPGRVSVVENWADPLKIFPVEAKTNPFIAVNALGKRFVVMYSGNLGFAQDLETVIKAARLLKDHEDILFLMIGEGALKDKLVKMASSMGLQNIRFLSYQEKQDLRFSLGAAHVHLIPLRNGMKGCIVPSKVYGIMAAGKPFIAAVDEGSEIALLVDEFCCGLRINPSDAEKLSEAVLWASAHPDKLRRMGEKGRNALENHFTPRICAQKFKAVIQEFI